MIVCVDAIRPSQQFFSHVGTGKMTPMAKIRSLCYLCIVFVMLSCLFIAALWSPAGKGLTSWLLFVMFNCNFVTFPMWYPGLGVVLNRHGAN